MVAAPFFRIARSSLRIVCRMTMQASAPQRFVFQNLAFLWSGILAYTARKAIAS